MIVVILVIVVLVFNHWMSSIGSILLLFRRFGFSSPFNPLSRCFLTGWISSRFMQFSACLVSFSLGMKHFIFQLFTLRRSLVILSDYLSLASFTRHVWYWLIGIDNEWWNSSKFIAPSLWNIRVAFFEKCSLGSISYSSDSSCCASCFVLNS